MKTYFSTLILLLLAVSLRAQTADYVPTKQNLEARKWFSNNQYGLFTQLVGICNPAPRNWGSLIPLYSIKTTSIKPGAPV